MKNETHQKLLELQALVKEKEAIEAKIEAILNPQPKVQLPPGFSLIKEVYAVIQEVAPKSIGRSDIITKVLGKFPTHGIDKKQIAATLSYLKNTKKTIDSAGYGEYVLVSDQKTESTIDV